MLHIVNKSPGASDALAAALRLAKSGALLLTEDAVYAATRGNPAEQSIRDAASRLKVYVLAPDLEARGMADRLLDGVTPVDHAGFVDLVVEQPNCQSWL
ncbi:MAG: sulfurtransferase complex subunit TusB [Burkholderiaceae bacterium]|nr:sulfurtransferase complex subunit TusB [Burkholderiaceae bacterium]